jgi:hypothetical protein
MVDQYGNPLLTNFAYSISISKAMKTNDYVNCFFIVYDPSYLEWPIEIHILCYLLTNKLESLSILNIETVINDFIKHHDIFNCFGNGFVSSLKEEAIQYFTKYVNQNYSFILTDILQHFTTWDQYALSIMYLRILIHMYRSIKNKNKFIILFMKLLVNNISLNPLKRYSIDFTIDKFDQFINSLEPNDYKELLTNLMSP